MEQGCWGGTSQIAALPAAPASSRPGRRRSQACAARPHQHGPSAAWREQLIARSIPQFPLSGDQLAIGKETLGSSLFCPSKADEGWQKFRFNASKFIILIIILVGLFSAIQPVQAAINPSQPAGPTIINVELKLDPQGYVVWSHDLYMFGTSLSKYEFITTRQKVLQEQTLPLEPPAWIHVNVSDATEWAKFIMRSDNYYVCAYQTREAIHSVEEYMKFFPGSIDLGFNGSYSGLNGERRNLTYLNLNFLNAQHSLWTLSRYKHGVSDFYSMKIALTRYVLILCEGQRFTEVDTCIRNNWNGDCFLARPHELLVRWGTLSCGILEGWKPNPRRASWWVKSREHSYKKSLKALHTTKAQASGLLRVLLMGTACQDNIKGVRSI